MEFYCYFTYEEFDQEDCSEFPGDYDWDFEDENRIFSHVAIKVVEERVRGKVEVMTPLLKNAKLSYLSVGIDILGINSVQAFCVSHREADGSIAINIVIGPELLTELLNEYWDPLYRMDEELDFVIDHELIHAADQNTLSSVVTHHLNFPLGAFMDWIGTWRAEGLADLPSFIDGHRGLKDEGAVIQRIREDLDAWLKLDLSKFPNLYAVEDSLPSIKYTPYAVGPMLMVKLLEKNLDIDAFKYQHRIDCCEELLAMLHKGLEMEFDTFLMGILELKSSEGIPFISPEQWAMLRDKLMIEGYSKTLEDLDSRQLAKIRTYQELMSGVFLN